MNGSSSLRWGLSENRVPSPCTGEKNNFPIQTAIEGWYTHRKPNS